MEAFEQIKGYEIEKKEIINVVNMINNYEYFKEKGITLPKGLLLHGEPDVGKTLIARAIAESLNTHFVEIDFSKLYKKAKLKLLKKVLKRQLETLLV